MEGKLNRGDQINWNQVFYFSEIAALGSVKAAGEKLGLSPSTLSAHLSQLEADLNIKLFDRQHRKIVLTPEGARLFSSAKHMFETGKRFIDLISPTSLGCYPISIGIVPGSSYSFAHGIIQDYIKSYENVSTNVLQFQHDDLESALLEAKLDFGFTDQKSERKNIVQVTVEASDLNFFVSSKLPRLDLKEHLEIRPLVICRSHRKGPSASEEVLESMDIPFKNLIVSEYPSLVESLCREGTCVAILGRRHFEDDPSVRMLRLPSEFPKFSEKLFATWHIDGENSEAIKRLKKILNGVEI
ncbi:MAG: LysR family transcriptional regulator [Chitinophagaceae bacterium]|nr:LysR family transcriptional regulator [Oligoflexus sp.]